MSNGVSSWGLFWDILWVFFLFIWIMILFRVITDLFRDHEESGVKKFFWCVFLIIAPFITLFVYVIVRGRGMAEREVKAQARAQSDFADYVKQVGGSGDPAAQIESAKKLLDSGAIDQGEFDKLKAKALA